MFAYSIDAIIEEGGDAFSQTEMSLPVQHCLETVMGG